MEIASLIQHERRTAQRRTAGSGSSSQTHAQPTLPDHSLVPIVHRQSPNDPNSHLGEGSSKETQIGPHLGGLHQERAPVATVDNTQANVPNLDAVLDSPSQSAGHQVDEDHTMRAPQLQPEDPVPDMVLPSMTTSSRRDDVNNDQIMQELQQQDHILPISSTTGDAQHLSNPTVEETTPPSRETSQTPRPQRWSWENAQVKQKGERAKKRVQLTALHSVCSNWRHGATLT